MNEIACEIIGICIKYLNENNVIVLFVDNYLQISHCKRKLNNNAMTKLNTYSIEKKVIVFEI